MFCRVCSNCAKRRRREGQQLRGNDPLTQAQRIAKGRRIYQRESLKRHPHRAYRQDACSRCGFVPEHSCQLDVDHIDGNRFNNDPSNFQTLCANCHRLKTILNRDHARRHTGVAA